MRSAGSDLGSIIGHTNWVEMETLPPDGVNLHALLVIHGSNWWEILVIVERVHT